VVVVEVDEEDVVVLEEMLTCVVLMTCDMEVLGVVGTAWVVLEVEVVYRE
jgi:hypothetical protein